MSENTISSVLVLERAVQELVYFVSLTLHDTETRYPPLERLAMALVFASWRLHPYFQVHTIQVVSDTNLRQILLKPKALGKLAKWAVELGEFDIEYLPRSVIKG